MPTLAVSHVTIATQDVPRITRFVSQVFEITAHFENAEFSEFILPSRFRIAFFHPVGKSAKTFDAAGARNTSGLGITVTALDSFFERFDSLIKTVGGSHEGAPKSHPWGEKSFLLIDPDGNRWEVTESPSADGMLVTRN